jgi:thioredoxin-like negative regulator of GroEL
MKRFPIGLGLGLALVAIWLSTVTAQTPSEADALFASARHKETVDGDFRGAIADYQQVVAQAGSNRALASEALLRMAEVYLKLGDAEAQAIYARIVKDFSDQPAAAEARARNVATVSSRG